MQMYKSWKARVIIDNSRLTIRQISVYSYMYLTDSSLHLIYIFSRVSNQKKINESYYRQSKIKIYKYLNHLEQFLQSV